MCGHDSCTHEITIGKEHESEDRRLSVQVSQGY